MLARKFYSLAFWLTAVLLVPALWHGQAVAQTQTPTPAIVEYTGGSSFDGFVAEAREKYEIYVFGDTLADGLGAGLRRLLAGNKKVKIQLRSRAGTGLARPDRYDWNRAVGTLIEGRRIDVAVVFIGGNDTHSVTTPQGRYTIGSDPWHKAYTAYVDQFVAQFKEHGAAVYWVGLPPMWREAYDHTTKMVTAIHRERVLAAGMKFMNIRALFADKNDKFTNVGFDLQGQFRRMRSKDGVHFLRHGNDKLAALIYEQIGKDIEIAEKGATSDFDNTLDGTTSSQSTSLNLPIFAQESETGAAIPVDLGHKIADVNQQTANANTQALDQNRSFVVSGTAQNVTYAPKVAPGSEAARVLLQGEIVTSKSGRADDFSWPAE